MPTVSHAPDLRKAAVRVSRSLLVAVRYRCWLSIHSPDRLVECPSQLLPPYVAEVSHPLRAW